MLAKITILKCEGTSFIHIKKLLACLIRLWAIQVSKKLQSTKESIINFTSSIKWSLEAKEASLALSSPKILLLGWVWKGIK